MTVLGTATLILVSHATLVIMAMHITSCIWNTWLISYLIANNLALVNEMFLTLTLDIMNMVLELLDEFW